MTTRALHYRSGIVIAVFTGLHLFNHGCAVFGAARHIEVMHALRLVYRNVFAETGLLAAVAVQIVSGIALFRKSRHTAATGFEKLHIRTGLYLAAFFVIHVGAVLAGRYLMHLDTNFYFGVAGLNTFPLNLFFVPYYALAIVSFFGHIASAHSRKQQRSLLGLSPHRQAKAMLIAGLLITVAILYGLTNHFRGVDIPEEYHLLNGIKR